MANEFFDAGSVPQTSALGASSQIRGEFGRIALAFDKLPALAGHGNRLLKVNSAGTALTQSSMSDDGTTLSYSGAPLVTTIAVQTLTGKTLDWANNTFTGFVSGLGIDLKADKHNTVLTGVPVAPSPGVGDNSPRIATTAFVNETVVALNAATPSNSAPQGIGAAAASGVATQFSRADHTHALGVDVLPNAVPITNGIAAIGTSGRVAYQDHVHPSDTSLAPKASPTFTGVPAAPTPATATNTTQLATTAFVQNVVAAAPTGMLPATDVPLMDSGSGAVGAASRGARADHIHPSDTSRAPLASPNFTGTPSAPTATPGANSTQLATTAFVAALGVTKQAASANLDEYAAVNPTAAGLALLDDADSAAQRVTLGVVIGTDVQAYDADIPTVSASQAEMEAGTESALRSMSPLRVKQAISALASGVKTFNARTGAVTLTSGDVTGVGGALAANVLSNDLGGGYPIGSIMTATAYGLEGEFSVASGGTAAGSRLDANHRSYSGSNFRPAGTWKNMTANTVATNGTSNDCSALWQRIA